MLKTTINIVAAVTLLLCSLASMAFASMQVHPVHIDPQQLESALNNYNNKGGVDRSAPLQLHISFAGHDIGLTLTSSYLNSLDLQDSTSDKMPIFYSGSVDGDPHSWARLHIDEKTVQGRIFTDNVLYRLMTGEAAERELNLPLPDSELVMIEPASHRGSAVYQGWLGRDYISYPPNFQSPSIEKQSAIGAPVVTTRNVATPVTRAMRIGIAIDSLFNENHGGRGLAVALSTMDAVDAIFQDQLGIAIIVNSIKIYDDPATDPMRERGPGVEPLLDFFSGLRVREPDFSPNLTLVHLFTGHRDPNNVLGLGRIDSACRVDGQDISLSTPVPFSSLLVAHEIAHNFGAFHDGEQQCLRFNLTDENTLMRQNIRGSTTTRFSSCSRQFMQPAISNNCNLDNIDFALTLRANPANATLQRLVNVQVTNTDAWRSGNNILTTTVFPAGTLLSSASAGCTINGVTLNCVYPTVAAGTTETGSVLATLTSTNDTNIESRIALLTIVDVSDTDNRATINLLQFNDDGAPIAVISDLETVASARATQSTENRLGQFRFLELCVLMLIVLRAFIKARAESIAKQSQ